MTGTATAQAARSIRPVDAVVGANVHSLMWRAKETQGLLADMLGIGQPSVSLKLRGARPWSATEVDIVARHYGVSHAVLFRDDSEPQRSGAGVIPAG